MATQMHVFTYWEGEDFSSFHYLTILSLHKYNPDLNIIIYTAKYPSNILRSWTSGEQSMSITNKMNFKDVIHINPDKITIKDIDFKEEYGLNNDISCVFKADFTRIVKLYEHGGMWFDMDILFTKPIPSYMFEFTGTKEMCYFTYLDAIPTGIISCLPQSTFISFLYKQLLNIISNNMNKPIDSGKTYQFLGPELWLDIFTRNYNIVSKTLNRIDYTDIYPILYTHLYDLYISSIKTIPENTWGIHWYNGHTLSKKFINNFNIKSDKYQSYQLGDSLIERYIKPILT